MDCRWTPPELLCQLSSRLAASGDQVVVHALVEWEDGGGGSNLSSHVTDGSHACATDVVHTLAVVLNNGTSSSLDSQDASKLREGGKGWR